jgi:hypothetical protein
VLLRNWYKTEKGRGLQMKQKKMVPEKTTQATSIGGRKKASWKRSDRWGIDDRWAGTSVIYAASGTESVAMSGDYDVTYQDESNPGELRAFRQAQRSRGITVKDLGEGKLHDQLVVIFGAEMSAANAVRTLKALISRIETEGLNRA